MIVLTTPRATRLRRCRLLLPRSTKPKRRPLKGGGHARTQPRPSPPPRARGAEYRTRKSIHLLTSDNIGVFNGTENLHCHCGRFALAGWGNNGDRSASRRFHPARCCGGTD